MCNRKGGNSGMCPDDSSLNMSNIVVVPSGDHTLGGTKVVEGTKVNSILQDNSSILAGNLASHNGASGRGTSLTNGSVLPIQYVTNGLDVFVHNPKHHNEDAFGGRGEGKKIKREDLNRGGLMTGKGRQFAKIQADKSYKGTSSFVSNDGRCCSFSGSLSNCYGEQSEESDIRRNNDRHWELLKRDVGERLWEEMLALGVVDTEGRKASILGDDSGCGGRKVVKKIVQ